MNTPDNLDRLTILERAQLLHDATLRRHGEIVDRHEERIARLEGLVTQLTDISARLETTMHAVLDLLRRGQNGH